MFAAVREDLIWEDIAEDHKNVGLVYIAGAIPADADAEPTAADIEISPAASRKLQIFLSYGHDSTTPLAERLKAYLEGERKHEVWLDCMELTPGDKWEARIEDMLDRVAAHEQGRLLFLMTPHSVLRPGGYCIKELTRALENGIHIVPIMLIQVRPPIAICERQWLDLRDCVPFDEREERLEGKLPLVANALEKELLDLGGAQSRIASILKPMPFWENVDRHLKRFTGRKWLIDKVDAWAQAEHAPPVLWITSMPGRGKTALACWLSAHRSQVAALHLCENAAEKGDPRGIVRSIAWQLANLFPDYLEQLKSIVDLREVCEEGNAKTLLDRLLVQPLHCGFSAPKQPVVVVIDGLDEVASEDGVEFAALLAQQIERFPDWMRFLLTSNSVAKIRWALQAFDPIDIDAHEHEEDNEKDLRAFLEAQLCEYASSDSALSEAVADLLKKSEGCFLYVEWIRRELEWGTRSLQRINEFPNGMGEVYAKYFQRRFPNIAAYEKTYRPVLEAVAAAQGRLPQTLLARVFCWSDDDSRKILAAFGAVFSIRDEVFRPFHGSLLEWLCDQSKSGRYVLKPEEGHKRLAAYGWREYERDVATMSEYMQAHLPHHLRAAGETEKLIECVTDAAFVYYYGKVGFLYSLTEFWRGIDRQTLCVRCLESVERPLARTTEERPFLALCGLSLGRLFQQTGDYLTAMRCYERALALSRKNAGDNTPARARFSIGWCQRHMDQFENAIATLEQARAEFRGLGDKDGEGRSLSAIGICYWHLQRDSRALECLDEALAVFDETNEKRHHAEALNHLGIVYRGIGQFDEALRSFRKAEEMFEEIQDLAGLGKIYNSMGTAYWWSDRTKKAFQQYERAGAANKTIQQPYVLGLTANNRGYLLLEKGDFQKAYA